MIARAAARRFSAARDAPAVIRPPLYEQQAHSRSRIPSTGGFAEDRRSAAPRLQGQRRIGWYRNAFSHTGQAETLEEWLDPARLKTDYVPRGSTSVLALSEGTSLV